MSGATATAGVPWFRPGRAETESGSSPVQEKAIGVQFGLAGLSKDACRENDMGFYRDKLINLQYLLDLVSSYCGVRSFGRY